MSDRKGRFTLVLIPHSTSRILSVSFSKTHLKMLATLFAAGIMGLGALGANYLHMYRAMPELFNLREVADGQRKQINALVTKTNVLDCRLRDLTNLDKQVRELLASVSLAPKTRSAEVMHTASIAGGVPGGYSIVQDSTISKDQGGGSLVLGGLALDRLRSMEEDVCYCEESLLECRAGLEQLNAELRACPSIWPVKGTLTSGFGYRRSPFGWGMEFHGGIDIAASRGTPIVATADGRIVFSGYKAGFGRTVVIDHGYGYRTSYSHNAENLVAVGDWVSRGQVVALVGTTGRTTGPHVHYEVYVGGQRVNPRNFVHTTKGM